MIRTIEVYDSFRQHLLEVKFELANGRPLYERSCRSSYGSLRPLMVKEERLEEVCDGWSGDLTNQHGK